MTCIATRISYCKLDNFPSINLRALPNPNISRARIYRLLRVCPCCQNAIPRRYTFLENSVVLDSGGVVVALRSFTTRCLGLSQRTQVKRYLEAEANRAQETVDKAFQYYQILSQYGECTASASQTCRYEQRGHRRGFRAKASWEVTVACGKLRHHFLMQ